MHQLTLADSKVSVLDSLYHATLTLGHSVSIHDAASQCSGDPPKFVPPASFKGWSTMGQDATGLGVGKERRNTGTKLVQKSQGLTCPFSTIAGL